MYHRLWNPTVTLEAGSAKPRKKLAKCKGEDCTAHVAATRTSGYCPACKFTYDRRQEVERKRAKREAQRQSLS